MTAILEHANITVSDPDATAAWLCEVFDWHIRWQGGAIDNGYTVHVGSDDSYLALYTPVVSAEPGPSKRITIGGLNHVCLQVDNLDEVEKRVKSSGFQTYNHGDYEPGRRFYFDDSEGIEFEVVQYT